ncbi:MAG: response regulator [Candidatus Thorarchaeota archaeon]
MINCDIKKNNRNFRILIVDDEEDVLKSLLLTINNSKEFKSTISIANDAKSALEKMTNEDFDLVLADYKMPGMNGLELLSKVNERFPDIAKILITGYSDIDIAKIAISKDFLDDYIEKPWHNNDLRAIIIETLIKKRKVIEK